MQVRIFTPDISFLSVKSLDTVLTYPRLISRNKDASRDKLINLSAIRKMQRYLFVSRAKSTITMVVPTSYRRDTDYIQITEFPVGYTQRL